MGVLVGGYETNASDGYWRLSWMPMRSNLERIGIGLIPSKGVQQRHYLHNGFTPGHSCSYMSC